MITPSRDTRPLSWTGEDASAKLAAPAPARSRFHFLTDVDVENQPPLQWLWDGVIPTGSFAEIHGPPETAKTFLGLAISLGAATGRPLFGRAMKTGPVIYVAAEGSAGLGVRVGAWKHREEFFACAGVYFATEPVELLDNASVGEFLASIDTLRLPAAPVLIVLDTFARCLVGGEENSARDVGLAISAIDHIRRATGATVLLIHHTRKDGEAERGSNALRGAADVMISLKREDARVTLSCDKQKDAPHFPPIAVEIVPTQDSCVLDYCQNGLAVVAPLQGSKPHQLLRSLQDVAFEDGATATTLLKASGMAERDFYRVLKSVVTGGYVERTKSGRFRHYSLSPLGRLVITDNCNMTAEQLPCR